MATPWTDESAILRDLSFAQGRWVPGGIDSAVAGGRPPTLNITEETEEEYYQRWTTDGDFSAGPDLFRIKKMLELMQGEESSDDDIPSGPIEIRKTQTRAVPMAPLLNPKAITFVPKTKANKTKENKDPAPNKPRRARNVAIASIMARNSQSACNIQSAQNNQSARNFQSAPVHEPLKLCKPEDFMNSKGDDYLEIKARQIDSIDKVRNWLQSQDITICSMFKKKSSAGAADAGSSSDRTSNLVNCGTVSMFKQSPVKSQTGDSDKCSSVRSPQNEAYTPSAWADEYYKKAVNRSQMRDLVRDDVWGRAEKVMKKIDEDKAEQLRKQQEAAALAAELAAAQAVEEDSGPENIGTLHNGDIRDDVTLKGDLDEDNSDGVAHIVLSKHRHQLQPAAACVVCRVLAPPPPAPPAQHAPAGVTATIE